MASHKAITFRIKHVPPNFTLERLTAAFQQLSNTDEPADLQLSGSLLPSCYASDRNQTAIVQFIPGPPKCLEGVLNDKTGVTEWQIKIDSSVISVDKNFFGFRSLTAPHFRETQQSENLAVAVGQDCSLLELGDRFRMKSLL